MMLPTLHVIYFSPTKTTQQIVTRIAAGIPAKTVIAHDLTLPQERADQQLTDGVAIIGTPVYAGRVPELCLKRLESISAQGMPVVLVVLYGNREFEDALVELQDVVTGQGFKVCAAGAFIGEHSYATPAYPIAVSRPDQHDLQEAEEFGSAIAHLLQGGLPATDLQLPGNRPYRERSPLGGIAPELDVTRCSRCGACAKVCPSGVISMGPEMVTDAGGCILCCACVRSCPVGARSLNHPMITGRREMLLAHCSSPKQPSLYLR